MNHICQLSVSLPVELQDRLAHLCGILDHRNIGDIMTVLSMVQQAFKTDDALPEVLLTPLLNRCHEYWRNAGPELLQYKDLIRGQRLPEVLCGSELLFKVPVCN